VHIPSGVLPRIIYLILTILTCGLYPIFLNIQKWCYEKKFCTPQVVEMSRGKMVITSKNRVLIWKTNVSQVKTGKGSCIGQLLCGKKCAAPVAYTGQTLTRTYTLDNISDVSLMVWQTAAFLLKICCCEETYSSAVRVQFGDFSDQQNTASLKVSKIAAFQDNVSAKFGKTGLAAAALSNLLALFPVPPDPAALEYVDIISFREDATSMDLEHPVLKESFDGLVAIQRQIATTIAANRAAVWVKPAADNAFGPIAMPVFTSTTKDSDFADLSLINEEACNMPSSHIALAPGEQIISSQSNMYVLNACDKIMICITCGCYYFLKLRAKRMYREGLLLTTHRIISLTVARDDSLLSLCLPEGLLCCCPTVRGLTVRSLFPKGVVSGTVLRLKKEVHGAILTESGAIEVSFDIHGLTLPAKEAHAVKRMTFFKTLANTVSRAASVVSNGDGLLATLKEMPLPDMGEGDGSEAGLLHDWALDASEQAVMPLLEKTETVLARFNGKIYEDLCDPLCMNERTWYPGAALICMCGIKPEFSKSSIIVTNQTVYCVLDNSNDPNCPCMKCGACEEGGFCFSNFKTRNCSVFWTPLSAMCGSEIDTILVGNETFSTRCCYKTFIGDNCCPMVQSQATVKVLLNSIINCVTVAAGHKEFRRPLRDDPNVARFQQAISLVQDQMNTAKATPTVTPPTASIGIEAPGVSVEVGP
jgi:hypothetical protein